MVPGRTSGDRAPGHLGHNGLTGIKTGVTRQRFCLSMIDNMVVNLILRTCITLAVVLPIVVAAGIDAASRDMGMNVASDKPISSTGSSDSEEEIREYARRYLMNVLFLSPQYGWAVGGDGVILSTRDGGDKWIKQKIGNQEFFRITFRDKRTGWLLGEKGFLKTDNAGRSWSPWTPPTPGALGPIRFVTPQIGWLVGRDGIFKTQDGGKTWWKQSSGTKEVLHDTACFSIQSCVIVGEKKTVLTTSNGGNTWTRRYPRIPDLYFISLSISRDRIAWAVAKNYKSGALLRSNDQGRTWTVASSSDDLGMQYPTSLFFFNAKRGLVAEESIQLTEDGAATWRTVWAGGPHLQSIFFVNDKLGWAVGDFKTVLHTKDGGETWVPQYQGHD